MTINKVVMGYLIYKIVKNKFAYAFIINFYEIYILLPYNCFFLTVYN